MAKAAPILNAFNAGELSPMMDGRTDLAKYASGCKRLQGFIGTVQGPAVRRAGTALSTVIKDQSKRAWLFRFEFSVSDALILEFGDQYIRFISATTHSNQTTGTVLAWSNATAYVVGDLVLQGGVRYYCILAHTNQVPPNATYWYALTSNLYEIPSPYLLADITNADGTCALKCEQSGDVVYIVNQKRTYAPRKLTRFAATRWTLTEYRPNQGPLLEQNTTAITLQADATTGNVTLTASADLFVATDVGRLVRLDSQNLDVRPWETDTAYVLNDLVRFSGRTYKALNGATSGTSPPIHDYGTAYDGKTGVQWEYMHAGYGIARITVVTDAQNADADVIVDEPNGLKQLPDDVVSTTTTRWQLGAWSATTEYPGNITFWNARLWFAGKQRYWGSVPNDYENMAGDFFGQTQFDNAIWGLLQGQDVNDIVWLAGADKLVFGTGGGEFIGDKITDVDPVGPANFEVLRQGKIRSRSIPPVAVGTSLLYVQRAGRKLLSLNYSVEIDRFAPTDLAVLSDRITRGGIIAMAFQSEPYSILWCVLNTGKLLGFTYDRDQDVVGWHSHPIGGDGFVESVATVPHVDGSRDEVYIIVRRTIGGTTRRYIEYLEKPWEGPDDEGDDGDDQADAFYVDSGVRATGVPATFWQFWNHLAGETVQVLADGAVHPDCVVAVGGGITLEREASTVVAGLPYVSRLVPMRLEGGGQIGTTQGKSKRVDKLTLRLLDSLGGKVGRYGGTLDSISQRNPATPMGQPTPFFSGDVEVSFPGDYDTDALLEVRQDQPLPMTVVAIMPNMKAYET